MVGFLASYWYYKRRDFSDVPGPLILDSGAFSAYTQGAEITVLELARFYQRVKREAGSRLEWMVSLDVLGDHAGSVENWNRLADHGLATVPVVHFTSPLSFEAQITPYLEAGATRVCFGGMVGAVDAVNRWAAHGLRWLRDNSPETLTHGLGVGPWVVRAKLPWDSTDCSDFGLGYRFGYVRLPHPERRKPMETQLGTGRPPGRQPSMVIRRYGVEPRDCTSPEPSVRCAAIARLSFRASEHEEALENARRRHAGLRPVTRFVVDGNVYAEPVIFDEMSRARDFGPYKPGRVPGRVA